MDVGADEHAFGVHEPASATCHAPRMHVKLGPTPVQPNAQDAEQLLPECTGNAWLEHAPVTLTLTSGIGGSVHGLGLHVGVPVHAPCRHVYAPVAPSKPDAHPAVHVEPDGAGK